MIKKIDDFRWEVPLEGDMKVSGIIYTDENFIEHIKEEDAITQVKNVAHLPGIVSHSFAMPDIHWGYGFPIGGVAATEVNTGVVSPGGVGYDINCGVRVLKTALTYEQIKNNIQAVINQFFHVIPCGIGGEGKIRLNYNDLLKVLENGAKWSIDNGYGHKDDLEFIEENGKMNNANPDKVSKRAMERGLNQLGTLGSGNHFIEIQYVEEIYDPIAANVFGLFPSQILVMIHTGSRGLGYQVCDDSIRIMTHSTKEQGISIPDKQLCCAYIKSQEGRDYLSAMACAANYAWANRQCISHWIEESFFKSLKISPRDLNLKLLYDVSHNIAKIEDHIVDGKSIKVCVHRKGATRAFAPGDKRVTEAYRDIGQPVLIPGDMGRYSYILTGTQKAMDETFGSTCHGAGRLLSRTKALKQKDSNTVFKDMEKQDTYLVARERKTIAEEASHAYKDIDKVINIIHNAGISKKVARLKPLGVIKG